MRLYAMAVSTICISFLFICCASAAASKLMIPKPYIVYMGGTDGSPSSGGGGGGGTSVEDGDSSDHLSLLSSIIPSEESQRQLPIHSYGHAFKGFSAMLTEDEAAKLSNDEEVVSVFPDPLLQLHTTRSWDFLGLPSKTISTSKHNYKKLHMSSDVIVGVIDTGIWPESASFEDQGIGEIPERWKGVCMESNDFKKSMCNKKLIGARFYSDGQQSINSSTRASRGSPRDSVGHGTHTASIAAGAEIVNASYYGLARGTARGGSPSARIASYKACSSDGCSGSSILKAIDDAVKDGVDIISISIGMNSAFQTNFLDDPIAIGAFHAQQKGVMVVCSGGNEGPIPYTLVNSAPWIFTVAASSVDRDFQSMILLGNGKFFRGTAINFSRLSRNKTYPLAFGETAANNFTSPSDARNCVPGSMDPKKVGGKIVVCLSTDPTISRRIKKLVVEDAKAKGLILIDEAERITPFESGIYPFAEVGPTAGSQILHYINSTRKPTATILATTQLLKSKPAPVVADFSSRGPGLQTENILKPDIMAPGVAILAAMVPNVESDNILPGKKPSPFGIKSGTSMSCPHVSGAAAFIKSVHPHWTSSMIKSALMTTASVFNNQGQPLTNSSNNIANLHETGAGEINPMKALNPGLVFETSVDDYLHFLCYLGYEQKKIRSISKMSSFKCPRTTHKEEEDDLLISSNINYPSISIKRLIRGATMVVKRVVTNVGSSPNATYYIASVQSPRGLTVKVSPERIRFAKEKSSKAAFNVSFQAKKASKGYNYGHITLSDGFHMVRLVFAVNIQ